MATDGCVTASGYWLLQRGAVHTAQGVAHKGRARTGYPCEDWAFPPPGLSSGIAANSPRPKTSCGKRMGVPQVNNTSNGYSGRPYYVETNRVIPSPSSLVEGESDDEFSSVVRANERSAVDCCTVVATPAPCSTSLQRSSHSGVVLTWSGPAPSFFLPQLLGVGRAR